MPPQHISLGLVSRNRQFNCKLTPYQRGVAIGMTFKGAKSFEIEVVLDCSCGAIQSTLKFAQLCNKGQSQIRTGAPKFYTNADERNLLWWNYEAPLWWTAGRRGAGGSRAWVYRYGVGCASLSASTVVFFGPVYGARAKPTWASCDTYKICT